MYKPNMHLNILVKHVQHVNLVNGYDHRDTYVENAFNNNMQWDYIQ